MKIKTKDFLSVGIILALGAALFVYSDSCIFYELNDQSDTMLAKQDHPKLIKLAANKKTANFLTNLSPKTKCSNTSDPQGGTRNKLAFATSLHQKTIGVDMKKIGILRWKVTKLYQ